MSAEPRLPESVQTVSGALAFWAAQTPDAPALRGDDGRELTHRELQRAVGAVAARLNDLGVGRADRVVLILPSGFDAAVALLGAMCAAIAVPLSPHATDHALRRDLDRLGARLVVIDEDGARTGRETMAEIELATITVDDLVVIGPSGAAPQPELPEAAADDLALIMHTSGTTGLPKRVPHPHRTLLACARAAHLRVEVGLDDTALVTAALHTISAPVHIVAALANGASCAVVAGLAPERFCGWLADLQPTWMVTTPAEIASLLDVTAGDAMDADSRLRAVCIGGQATIPGLAERAARRLRAPVLTRYGMTEVSYIAWSGVQASEQRAGSCGRPLGVAVRIVDDAGADVSPGVSGDVVVRGSTLFPGYLDDAAANAEAFVPGGWFRTGDIGFLDEDGFLFLTGRRKELINRGGESIAPAEIDAVLMSHPAVAEAAVFAVPDARLGEDVVAAVVLNEGMSATGRELRSWLLDRLSVSKTPRRIRFMDALPKTSTGKVRRGELARWWGDAGC